MQQYEYFLILLLIYLVALFFKWKYKITVFRSTKEIIIFYAIIFVLGSIWDNYAVWRGHWYYPGTGITGIFIGLIPIEDYFFAVVCSYTILVLYKLMPKILNKKFIG